MVKSSKKPRFGLLVRLKQFIAHLRQAETTVAIGEEAALPPSLLAEMHAFQRKEPKR